MKVTETDIPGVLVLEPAVFRDERGYFMESWSRRRYTEAGIPGPFVQDNLSYSKKDVLRGLHYQQPHAQAKLVSVLRGEVFDVAVDIRRGSPTFGDWIGSTLSVENSRQLYIPEGFAHGFVVTSDEALVAYKCSAHYAPDAEGTVLWDDPELGIEWPVAEPHLSSKDREGCPLGEIPPERLPSY